MDKKFKDQKILIFGLGLNRGGLSSAKFFAKQGAKVKVTDLKIEEELKPSLDELKEFNNIEYALGEHRYEDFDWADLIIKNQGVKPDSPYLKYAQEKGKSVEMDVGIFLEFVNKNQLIGITGTKGKTTTTTLIYEILKKLGKKAILVGNLGKGFLDSISEIEKDTLIVAELSSFQLEAFDQHKISPKYSLITNIYPDHLNYYQNMDEYINAKKIIAQYQTQRDYLFLRKNDSLTNQKPFLEAVQSKIIYFSSKDLPDNFKSELVGEHNRENIAASLALVKILGIDEDKALNIASSFQGVTFRMQPIHSSPKIINDTTSTTPIAAIQALKSLPNCILIAGGMNKNLDYKEFAKAIDQFAKEVYFLEGDATEDIKKLMNEKTKIRGTFNNLENLLIEVKKTITKEDTILFSPGATSFNLFQNEFDRGNKFNLAVKKIFN